MMAFTWEALVELFDRVFPLGTPKRKLLQILAIVLLFEGISVMLLFSKAGFVAGVASLVLGAFLLLVLYPERREEAPETGEPRKRPPPITDTPGLKLVDFIYSRVGGSTTFILAGASIIAAVMIWNALFSANPGYGDLDTLTILFGGIVMVYPFTLRSYKVEASFTLMFIALVVIFLVIPQALMSTGSRTGTSIGNWYVEYMLAKPFAGLLNIVGIDAVVSNGNMVTIWLQDGTARPLVISAYCAGLYSFSIFLAAFFSFVLTFERLPPKTLVAVLAIGLMIAFLGNLLRMFIIGVVGYYKGIPALMWTHENVGWIIFLSWSAIFWYFLLGYASKHQLSRDAPAETEGD